MTALDLMLPEHLYKESRNRQGEVTGVTYLHDRLINWCDRGKGVQELCRTLYADELANISQWEDDQLLMLEEEWLVIKASWPVSVLWHTQQLQSFTNLLSVGY